VPELVQPPTLTPSPAVPVAEKDKPTAVEKVYDFLPGTTFAVSIATSVPLDLVLEPGEEVRNIVGGSTAKTEDTQAPHWEVQEGGEGAGETFRPHIFLTATAPGLTTGLIVTTTRRTYYLTCKTVQASSIRAVRWRYPATQIATPKPPQTPGLLPDPEEPKQYHVGYDLSVESKPPPAWLPRHIVDDGKKTYILYPEVALFETVPVVRLMGPNGPQLVNARQYLNVVILDQLVGRAELRVGLGEHAETVTITRGTLRTISCPGDEACPVWPKAATELARRHP